MSPKMQNLEDQQLLHQAKHRAQPARSDILPLETVQSVLYIYCFWDGLRWFDEATTEKNSQKIVKEFIFFTLQDKENIL